MTLPIVPRPIKTSSGFSLVELMIALAVLAIVLGFAVPSMRKMVLDNRVKSATAELVAALNYARSEAIAINDGIYFCAAPDNQNPAENCYKQTDIYKYGAQIEADSFSAFHYRTSPFPNITITADPTAQSVGTWSFSGKGIFCDGHDCYKTARLFITNEGDGYIARTICIGSFGQIKTLEGTKAEGMKACQ